ncbi:hypothetical protein D6789_01425 [Candidatus Woesearchaeota archaeon]|nr:MAG: hypothetical protein D6789_01425 [Candidatus Woesearchaeota archaeon]
MIAYILAGLVLVVLSGLLFHRYWFCRQPRRRVPRTPKSIVSPANGRLTVIKQFSTPRTTVQKWNRGSVEVLCEDVAPRGWFLLIVMTPLNVHYQRAPSDATLLDERYHAGSFRNAVKNAEQLLTLGNERNEMLFEGTYGRFKVVQIAGFLARRITSFLNKGQAVRKGEVIGFINLGSQVAVVLPENVELAVREGETLIDGESILGVWT